MNWYERRAELIDLAAHANDYYTPRHPRDRRIGRVLMPRQKYGPWEPGFYALSHPQYAVMERHFHAKHKKATAALPK